MSESGINWCDDFDVHLAAHAHEFCELHQLVWCRLCDGCCTECRYQESLGEPDDDEEPFDVF